MTFISDEPEMVVFVGGIRPSEYLPLLDRGLKLALLRDPNNLIASPDPQYFAHIEEVDCASADAETALARLISENNVRAVITVSETAVRDQTKLARHFGYSAPTEAATDWALEKSAMRKRFVEKIGPHSTSASVMVEGRNDLTVFAAANGYPIVLKPTNLFGSMFVLRCDDADELQGNYASMETEIRKYLDSAGRVSEPVGIQAETLLLGTNHSIDCIVDRRGEIYPTEIVDVLTEKDFGVDRFQHYARFSPSRLQQHRAEAVVEAAKAGIRALELSSCVAHVEIIYTNAGPKLLEIAARPGGNRVHLMSRVFGIDVIGAYYDAVVGRPFSVARKSVKPTCILSLYPEQSGRFKSVERLNELKTTPGYVSHGLRVAPGEPVGPAHEGHLPLMSIELQADTLDLLLERIHHIRSLGRILTVDTNSLEALRS